MTLDNELGGIWSKKFNLVSFLFVANRYSMIANRIGVVALFLSISNNVRQTFVMDVYCTDMNEVQA